MCFNQLLTLEMTQPDVHGEAIWGANWPPGTPQIWDGGRWRIVQKSSNLWGVMPQGSRNVALFPHCWSIIPIIIIIHHTSFISTSRNIENSWLVVSHLCWFPKRPRGFVASSWNKIPPKFMVHRHFPRFWRTIHLQVQHSEGMLVKSRWIPHVCFR